MGNRVSPQTYLIGYSNINMDGLRAYLIDTGNLDFLKSIEMARQQGLSDGEIMASFYAKLCYASLTLGKNSNVTRVRDIPDNLVACFNAGHGCYDGDTDVLTIRGWKAWPDVTRDDELATMLPNGDLVYRNPQHVLHDSYRGRMYRVTSQHVDLLVTPNHRMFVCMGNTKQGRLRLFEDYRCYAATDLDRKRHAYLKTANWRWTGKSQWSPDVLRLLGFTIGDGYFPGGCHVQFHLRRQRKILWLRSVVSSLGWELRELEHDKYAVALPEKAMQLFRGIYNADKEKVIPGDILYTQDAYSLSGLLAGLLESDGHASETGDSFDTTSEVLVGQFQQLCLHVGLAANVSYTLVKDNPDHRPLTRLTVLGRSLRPEVNRQSDSSGRTEWVDGWEGDIHCAEMSPDTLQVVYVRRGGRPVWCGNSVFGHVNLNFVTTNCSRVFCYAADTEMFRDDGWVNVTELKADDKIMALDTETGQARWTPVLSMHQFPYEGELLGWANSQMLSPMMTPDHTLWLAWHDKLRARNLSAHENVVQFGEKVPIGEAFGKRFSIRKDIPWPTTNLPETLVIGANTYDTIDVFSWLGWLATDGCLALGKPSMVEISQSKVANLPAIRQLMDRMFPGRWRMYGPYSTSDQVFFRLFDRDMANFAVSHLGPNKQSRKFSPWLLNAGTVYLREFLRCAIQGDGSTHKANGHQCLYCSSPVAAGQYQVIGAMLGMPANLREDDRVGQTHQVRGAECGQTRVSYIVDFSRRGGGTLVKPEYQFKQPYSGVVYCPKTEEGVIFVRKKGHPFWCGNTHELVRNHIGTEYSQTSGRYCRLDKIDYVWDDILAGCEDDAAQLIQEIENFVYLAECKKGLRVPNPQSPTASMTLCLGYLPEDGNWDNCHPDMREAYEKKRWVPNDALPFDIKKKITSAIRRFAPNGQSNEIGWSINVRALRHVMQMRTSRHAEKEIRLVMNQAFDLVKDKFPMIFHGYRVRMFDGLREIYGMRTQPYAPAQGNIELLQDFSVSQLETAYKAALEAQEKGEG